MVAILKREFNAYFKSMLGYVFLALFLILSGAMFIFNNILYGSTDMNYYFSQMITACLFILPILTMRLFADEKKQKTDQLLLTAPISLFEIVLGKFLAAFSVLAIATAITIIYPIILSFYGSLAVAQIISAYIGFLLFSGAIIAFGCFMSSLTDSQILAAVGTYGILIIMVFFEMIISSNVSNPIITKILSIFLPISYFNDFSMGMLNIEPILYYVSMIAVFLYSTVWTFERRRWK